MTNFECLAWPTPEYYSPCWDWWEGALAEACSGQVRIGQVSLGRFGQVRLDYLAEECSGANSGANSKAPHRHELASSSPENAPPCHENVLPMPDRDCL